jgi:hypothetical protein
LQGLPVIILARLIGDLRKRILAPDEVLGEVTRLEIDRRAGRGGKGCTR